MLFTIVINVLPKADVPSPESASILGKAQQAGFENVQSVRAGKLFEIKLESANRHRARRAAKRMSRVLLAHGYVEEFKIVSIRKG